MAIYKRSNTWWIRFSHNGERVQKSAGTADRVAAQQLHDKLKAELWRVSQLKAKPTKTWVEAAMRWLSEAQHKKSLSRDQWHLRWLDPYFGGMSLHDITREVIERVAAERLKQVSGARVNLLLALIRAILRKAEREWEWIERAPIIKMRPQPKGRLRWLTSEEAEKLISTLPEHLGDMAAFTLYTGLRESNVTGLRWKHINMERCHAWVVPEESKTGKAIAIPLNAEAMRLLRKHKGLHPDSVFTYKGKPVKKCNTKAWRNALQRRGIVDFRWHDLRHTWASWHVQQGTSLQELQQLGGWRSFDMVLRYAHLSSEHLREAANRLNGTKLVQQKLRVV